MYHEIIRLLEMGISLFKPNGLAIVLIRASLFRNLGVLGDIYFIFISPNYNTPICKEIVKILIRHRNIHCET